jgi:hypothetical protein
MHEAENKPEKGESNDMKSTIDEEQRRLAARAQVVEAE